jgi:hypothetical protein
MTTVKKSTEEPKKESTKLVNAGFWTEENKKTILDLLNSFDGKTIDHSKWDNIDKNMLNLVKL